jgi:hypothetical protein
MKLCKIIIPDELYLNEEEKEEIEKCIKIVEDLGFGKFFYSKNLKYNNYFIVHVNNSKNDISQNIDGS